jgi:hypothetical protein
MFNIFKYKKQSSEILCKINNYSNFAFSKTGDFFQAAPTLGNQYDQDPFLIELLRNSIPYQVSSFQCKTSTKFKKNFLKYFQEIDADLRQFGHQVSDKILKLHFETERYPPKLENIDEWGHVNIF